MLVCSLEVWVQLFSLGVLGSILLLLWVVFLFEDVFGSIFCGRAFVLCLVILALLLLFLFVLFIGVHSIYEFHFFFFVHY